MIGRQAAEGFRLRCGSTHHTSTTTRQTLLSSEISTIPATMATARALTRLAVRRTGMSPAYNCFRGIFHWSSLPRSCARRMDPIIRLSRSHLQSRRDNKAKQACGSRVQDSDSQGTCAREGLKNQDIPHLPMEPWWARLEAPDTDLYSGFEQDRSHDVGCADQN